MQCSDFLETKTCKLVLKIHKLSLWYIREILLPPMTTTTIMHRPLNAFPLLMQLIR